MADIFLNVLRLSAYLGITDVGTLVSDKLKADYDRFAGA